MLFKLNSNTPPVASLLVLEKLKNAIQVDVEWAKGNLLQPSKVRIVLSGWLCYILRCAVPGQINHAHWTTKEKCKVLIYLPNKLLYSTLGHLQPFLSSTLNF